MMTRERGVVFFERRTNEYPLVDRLEREALLCVARESGLNSREYVDEVLRSREYQQLRAWLMPFLKKAAIPPAEAANTAYVELRDPEHGREILRSDLTSLRLKAYQPLFLGLWAETLFRFTQAWQAQTLQGGRKMADNWKGEIEQLARRFARYAGQTFDDADLLGLLRRHVAHNHDREIHPEYSRDDVLLIKRAWLWSEVLRGSEEVPQALVSLAMFSSLPLDDIKGTGREFLEHPDVLRAYLEEQWSWLGPALNVVRGFSQAADAQARSAYQRISLLFEHDGSLHFPAQKDEQKIEESYEFGVQLRQEKQDSDAKDRQAVLERMRRVFNEENDLKKAIAAHEKEQATLERERARISDELQSLRIEEAKLRGRYQAKQEKNLSEEPKTISLLARLGGRIVFSSKNEPQSAEQKAQQNHADQLYTLEQQIANLHKQFIQINSSLEKNRIKAARVYSRLVEIQKKEQAVWEVEAA